MKICVLHLDLGIGGAEKLIVNLCLTAQRLHHEVTIVTTHHDPSRCFMETKPDGVLGSHIRVFGDFLPRNLLGGGTALCAYIRMLYAAIQVVRYIDADVILLDGVSFPIPILRLFGFPVLFYCHYPDKLLVQNLESMSYAKRTYRLVIDWLEEQSTSCADMILVNSDFTARQFQKSFLTLGARYKPEILYPTVKDSPPDAGAIADSIVNYTEGFEFVFVSLNRYERKKNHMLAIQALELLLEREKDRTQSVVLVIAGGYDERVSENVSYFQELKSHVDSKGLGANVVLRRSISEEEMTKLLSKATAVLYTPENEHFGIVPVEAMQLGTPVIAVNSGGPLETVDDQNTGFLCPSTPVAFADAMELFVMDPKLSKQMGAQAVVHVQQKFTDSVMSRRLDSYFQQLLAGSRRTRTNNTSRLYLEVAILLSKVLLFAIGLAILHVLRSILRQWS